MRGSYTLLAVTVANTAKIAKIVKLTDFMFEFEWYFGLLNNYILYNSIYLEFFSYGSWHHHIFLLRAIELGISLALI